MALQFGKTSYKRSNVGRTVLFSSAVAIQNIEQITVETEFALQGYVHDWVKKTVRAVKREIEKLDVIDTRATYEGVYGVYPIAQSKQRILRGSVQKQQEELSYRSLEEYARAVVKSATRRKMKGVVSSSINLSTMRPKEGVRVGDLGTRNNEGRQVNTQFDAPFNPIGNVTRKNLYGGVGVITWYSIFPHEGLGYHEEKGPRQFFKVPVEREQARLIKKFPKLESTVRGKFRMVKEKR